jgi:hypothetical protein
MKKKLVVSLLSLSMALSMLVGCGSSSSDTGIAESNDEETQAMVETAIESTIETAEATNEETGSAKEAKEPSYIEHDSYYEDENFDWSGNTVLDTYQTTDIKFTSADNSAYAIYDSIDLYATNGNVMGYTKEDIWCFLTATADDWYCLTIDDRTFFVKASDFEGNNALLNASNMGYDGNYIIPDRSSTTTSSDTTSTNSNTTSNSNEVATSKETNNTTSNTTTNETSTNVSNETTTTSEIETSSNISNETTTTSEVETSSTTSSASNDKYTPDEAFATYRSILESNGMTWDPTLPSDGASWGTGWIYLKKSSLEEEAQSDLKGYAYGDGGGRSDTRYYMEITSYDDNKIYVTVWAATN